MPLNTVISYPIPDYSNPPIEPQFYIPGKFFITAITLGEVTTVTTSVNHNYVIGQQVRILIPNGYGCVGLNEQTGFVIEIPSITQVVVDIFSIGIDPFFNAMQPTQPQILAIGDINSGQINSSGRLNQGTFVPGSFINISPL